MKRITPQKDKVFFYTLSDPETKEIKYIGKTWITLSKRLNGHVCEAKRAVTKFEGRLTKRKPSKLYRWINNLTKRGLRPEINFLSEEYRENWELFEINWIAQFRGWGFDLVNTSNGGYGSTGHSQTEDTKKRISLANKGTKPAPQAIQASIEYNNKKVKQYTKEMEFVKEWNSSKIASESLKIHSNSISNVLCNRAKTAGGFVWKY